MRSIPWPSMPPSCERPVTSTLINPFSRNSRWVSRSKAAGSILSTAPSNLSFQDSSVSSAGGISDGVLFPLLRWCSSFLTAAGIPPHCSFVNLAPASVIDQTPRSLASIAPYFLRKVLAQLRLALSFVMLASGSLNC
jgi:hypothetical protein